VDANILHDIKRHFDVLSKRRITIHDFG
jgi:hypothetical protein